MIEVLLAANPRLATARRDGVSAILLAMYCHNADVIPCLRPHVQALDIFEASVDMVEALLSYGADRSLQDSEGLTAADHARARGHAELAERLGGVAWS